MNSIIRTLKSYKFRHFNIRLVLWVSILTILGINVIASATHSDTYEKKQIFGFCVGMAVLLILAFMSYHFVLKFYWVIYLFNLALLLAVKFFGDTNMGAKRWIDFGAFQLQPSEFTKLFLILFFARYLEKYKEKLNTVPVLLGAIVFFVVPWFLIFKQPDLSTSIVIGLLFCGIMYIAGLSYKIIFSIFAIVIPVAGIFIYLILQPDQKILEPYQYERLVGFFDTDNEVADSINYQQLNSVMAIGTGGLTGKGLNNNTTTSVKNGNYISEPQTDFIFCIVGEELGFVGTSSVIVLMFLIILECFIIGAHAPDLSGRIIACGFGILLAVQTFVNIGVVTMILPNTGLPLPFVSYGLSSLLSLFPSIGIILNIGMQRRNLILYS